MTEIAERQRVLQIAESWIGTPYHHAARIKGAGVDCAQLFVAVFEEAGLEIGIIVPRYPPDWYMHRGDEILLDIVLDRGVEITQQEAKPADVVVYRFGRCFSHGGIITGWPNIIHAFQQARKVTRDIADQGILADRERRFFTRKAWRT